MAEKFSIEDLDQALAHPNIVSEGASSGDEIFSRLRKLKIADKEYVIEWYSNACYLYCGGLIVPFRFVKQSGTWPNMAKVNLQFYNSRSEVCAVLPIEYWKEPA